MATIYEVKAASGVTIQWVPAKEKPLADRAFREAQTDCTLYKIVDGKKYILEEKRYVGKNH